MYKHASAGPRSGWQSKRQPAGVLDNGPSVYQREGKAAFDAMVEADRQRHRALAAARKIAAPTRG